MDDLNAYSLDSMTNVSSLVPMNRAALSGREDLNNMLQTFVQA